MHKKTLIRDMKDAASFVATHIGEGDTPSEIRRSQKQIKMEVLSAGSQSVVIDVARAYSALKPVDNGRRPLPQHMLNPIIIGTVLGQHII